MGLLFETLCIRDLRVFAGALDGQVYHFRDKNGLECDAVVHLRNGKFGLVEIKLGGDQLIEQGAATLKTLAAKIDTDKIGKDRYGQDESPVLPYDTDGNREIRLSSSRRSLCSSHRVSKGLIDNMTYAADADSRMARRT